PVSRVVTGFVLVVSMIGFVIDFVIGFVIDLRSFLRIFSGIFRGFFTPSEGLLRVCEGGVALCCDGRIAVTLW
ncbi:hypothetical protein QYY28_005611, partial [Escherichia coli]|nr:hypothetical protein [Escherichia coli]